MLITDPALRNVNPAAISDHLLEAGLTGIMTNRTTDGLEVTANQGDAAIESALSGFSSQAGDDYVRIPPEIRSHLAHMLDYETAVRNGSQASKTSAARLSEIEHVVADIVGFHRLRVDRLV